MLVKIEDITIEQVASICDHTFLNRSEAYKDKAQKGESPVRLRQKSFEAFILNTLARFISPYAICVRAEDVAHARKYLNKNKSKLKIAATVGFPDGAWYSTQSKLDETKQAILEGADEIDFVLNYDKLKNTPNGLVYVASEIERIVDTTKTASQEIRHPKIITKMILETSELNKEEIIDACILANNYGVDFVKTSTGFSSAGATPENLKLMRENFPRGIKISGGVKTENVKKLLYAASGRTNGYLKLNPFEIRIGESSLLVGLLTKQHLSGC